MGSGDWGLGIGDWGLGTTAFTCNPTTSSSGSRRASTPRVSVSQRIRRTTSGKYRLTSAKDADALPVRKSPSMTAIRSSRPRPPHVSR